LQQKYTYILCARLYSKIIIIFIKFQLNTKCYVRTLVGDRWGREGRVFSEFAETVLRPRSGNGVIPQVIKQTHESDVGEYGILDRYLTKEKVEHVMGFKTISGPLILIHVDVGSGLFQR
jgi:hypothetical protein